MAGFWACLAPELTLPGVATVTELVETKRKRTMTEESAVKVCVRVRPLIQREEESTDSTEPGQVFWKADKHSIQQLDDGNLSKSYNFDRVFNSAETTDQLYQELAKPRLPVGT